MNTFFAMLFRMRYIQRWALMRNQNIENLSEHTLDVALITHALINIANTRLGEHLDENKGATLALFHDVPEILTGDLPTPIKYNNVTIKNAYKDIEDQAIETFLGMLPDDLKANYKQDFYPDPIYIQYIKAADKISALIKCIEERKAGNSEFISAEKQTKNHESLNLPAAKIFLKEFLPSYELTLDELQNK